MTLLIWLKSDGAADPHLTGNISLPRGPDGGQP